jgi:hypothetical protein
MLFACTNEKGEVNVRLFESNDYGMTRVRRRITGYGQLGLAIVHALCICTNPRRERCVRDPSVTRSNSRAIVHSRSTSNSAPPVRMRREDR